MPRRPLYKDLQYLYPSTGEVSNAEDKSSSCAASSPPARSSAPGVDSGTCDRASGSFDPEIESQPPTG